MILNIVFFVAFISVFTYLIAFFRFTRRFPKMYPELWRTLGCPESLGLRGQSTYLGVVLGMERKVPQGALQEVRSEILTIRVFLGLTLVGFITAAFMTG